jgi:putative lipoprotein
MHLIVTVQLPVETPLPETARLFVEVRDVSLADAAAVTLAARVLPAHALSPAGKSVQLTFDLAPPAGNRRLNVWAHLSISGTRTREQGDFLTTRAYPVDEEKEDEHVTIELQKI